MSRTQSAQPTSPNWIMPSQNPRENQSAIHPGTKITSESPMAHNHIRSSHRGKSMSQTITRLVAGVAALFLLSSSASAQAVAPYMRLQFLTNAGAPCASCKLNTYGAGTSTPLSTYSNQGLSTANDNPIIMNSAGRPASSSGAGVEVNVYLSTANYKFVLTTSAGTIIWTADNVVANASGLVLPSTYAVGDILYANTTTTLAKLADVATGSILASGGVSAAPAWSSTPTVTSLTAGTLTSTGAVSASTSVTGATGVFTTSVTTPSVSSAPLGVAEGRLTCTTAVPVTTADCTGVTSLYWTPYKGNRIALYDGSAIWNTRTFTEITISVSGCTASKPYDVFLYDNATVVTAEILVWTDATTRATALTLQNGVLVKTGVTTRRYVGSFYCNSSGGQTDDSAAKRNVSNYYHRVTKPFLVVDTTDSWAYTTATWRQANANTANQVEAMVGWAEVTMNMTVTGLASNSGGPGGQMWAVAIGEDSTSTPVSGLVILAGEDNVAARNIPTYANMRRMPAVGRHTYVWLETAAGSISGTTTWLGDGGITQLQAGLIGSGDF